jgi:uncharacterized cupredoxin-like copper-binding protein
MEKTIVMRKLFTLAAMGLLALVGLALTGTLQAQVIFDPSVHRLVRMEPLVLGSEENSFYMEPREYRLKVGQGYRWKIKAATDFEYAFVAPTLFRNVWVRKVEIGDIEIKTGMIDEIEFEDVGEVEVFFVAVRPGTYEFGLRGMEARGMKGTIIVESDEASAAATPRSRDSSE